MKIVIQSSADEDLAEGFSFYEQQEAGLGVYFLDSLSSDIDSLKLYAGIHIKVFDSYRLLSRRFPYAVYYSIEGEMILVEAVLDCRRDPTWIQERLKKNS